MNPHLSRSASVAHYALAESIHEAFRRGEIPPCAVEPDAWFHRLRIVREMAARKCLSLCPLVDACARAGATEDEGVWGGIDRTTETSRKRNHHGSKTNHYEAS